MDSKFRGLLTDELIAEVKAITPTEREAMLLKSLDESDVTKFTPEDKLLEEETSSQPVVAEEEKVVEPEPEKVVEPEETKPEPVVEPETVSEPEPASEPEPVVAAEPEVKEEETPSADEKDKPIVVALTNDLSDGKRPDEETSLKEYTRGEPGKAKVVAINHFGEEEPEEEEPVEEQVPTTEPEQEVVEEKPVESVVEAQPEPTVEPEPVVEATPVAEPEPVSEPEPVVEEEKPVEEEKTVVEEVVEAPVAEPAPEPVVEPEPIKVEEPAPVDNRIRPVIIAINDDLSDGKRPNEEKASEEPKPNLGKIEVVAITHFDEKAPVHEEKEEVAEKSAQEKVEEPIDDDENDEPREGETLEEAEARRKLRIRGSISEEVGEAGTSKIPGKFEVFPEDDEFKYRLKASNGEILVVSYGYTTREGAHAGIDTLKKNLESGVVAYITDKNNRSQWRLSTSNEARIVALGETYSSLASAQSAFASTQKFGKTDRIIDLDEIPARERRTWEFVANQEDEKDSGTLEIYDDNGKFRARLLANNQEVLFVTAQSYSSKSTLKAALDNIKEKLGPNAFHLSRDKQDQYQFIMESGSGFVYLVGESYSTGTSAKSAAASVLSFIRKAEVVDLTLKSANVDVELTGVKK